MLKDVIARMVSAQPEVHLQNHEGYYRHSDVSALIVALGVHDAALKEIQRVAQDQTIEDGVALDMIVDLARDVRL